MGMLLAPYGSFLHGLYEVIFVAMLISSAGLHIVQYWGGGGDRREDGKGVQDKFRRHKTHVHQEL